MSTPPLTPFEAPVSSPCLEIDLSVNDGSSQNYDFLLAAAHFIGDGMALHNCANELFSLLGNSRLTEEDLADLLDSELSSRWHAAAPQGLPSALESGLLLPQGKLHNAISRVDFESSQARLIVKILFMSSALTYSQGGHAFPRRSGGSVHTVVPTIPIDQKKTKHILKVCKSHGVSISSVMFALCNLAWARTCDEKRQLPMYDPDQLSLLVSH